MKETIIILAFILALVLLIDWIRLRKEHSFSQEQNQGPQVNDTSSEASSDREIERLLDAFPDPFFSISEEGKVLRVNRAAEELFVGRSISGRSIQALFLDAALIEAIQQALDSWEPNSTILRLPPNSPFSKAALGKESHWEIDLSPLSLKRNSLELQVMMRDITAGVHTEQVRQDFVANASHELRTPLSIISGYLENLTEEGVLEDNEMSQKMLQTMVRHVDRINRIVEDILVISKLESEEGMPLKIEPFAIGPCVRDVIERLEPVIAAQNAKVTVDLPELTLEGDRFYWTQILFNLVENALKQNASMPVKVQILGERIGNNQFQLQIKDNGIGIPSGDLPFIFKRFFRVEKHHSQTQIKGTGLGLSIVKRAVEAHGGVISAASIPGVETAFNMIIPVTYRSRSETPTA